MYVDHLPPDDGMLFQLPRSSVLNFWGKNTFIPLDIAFVDSSHVIRHIGHIEPMSLKGVPSVHPCCWAIEANAGYFGKHGIKVGSKIGIDNRPSSRTSSLLSPEEAEANYLYVTFSASNHNIEGNSSITQKDKLVESSNVRVSQMMGELGLGETVPKKNEPRVGDPIGVGPEDKSQVGMTDLPVLSTDEIGAKLEDQFDPQEAEQIEQQELQDQQQPAEEEQTELPPDKEYPVFQNAFQAAEWAEQNSEVMRISYTTAHGRQLTREVEPHGQFHSKSTHRQILVTFDRSVGDIRAFILMNINHWSFVGQQFQKKFIVKG